MAGDGNIRADVRRGRKFRPGGCSERRRRPDGSAFPTVPQIAMDAPGYAITRWAEAIRAASQDAAMQHRLAENGLVPCFESPSEFSRTISADRAGWREVIRGAGIRAE